MIARLDVLWLMMVFFVEVSCQMVTFTTRSRQIDQGDVGDLTDSDPETCVNFDARSTPPCHTDLTLTLTQDFKDNVTVVIVGDCDQSEGAGKLFVVPVGGNATGQPLGQTKTCTPVAMTLPASQVGSKPYCTLSCGREDGHTGAIRITHRPYHMPCESWSLCEVIAPPPVELSDPALIQDVTASSTMGEYTPDRVFDNSVSGSSFWNPERADTDTGWIQVEFKSARTVQSVGLTLFCGGIYQHTLYRISFSDGTSEEVANSCPPGCAMSNYGANFGLSQLAVTPTRTTTVRIQGVGKCDTSGTFYYMIYELVISGY